MAGFYKSVEQIIDGLNALRTNEKFSSVIKECNDQISNLDLEELKKEKCQKELVEQLTNIYIVSHVIYKNTVKVIDTAVAGLQNQILNQSGVKEQVLIENSLLQRM